MAHFELHRFVGEQQACPFPFRKPIVNQDRPRATKSCRHALAKPQPVISDPINTRDRKRGVLIPSRPLLQTFGLGFLFLTFAGSICEISKAQ
jgi:hypothetical protein